MQRIQRDGLFACLMSRCLRLRSLHIAIACHVAFRQYLRSRRSFRSPGHLHAVHPIHRDNTVDSSGPFSPVAHHGWDAIFQFRRTSSDPVRNNAAAMLVPNIVRLAVCLATSVATAIRHACPSIRRWRKKEEREMLQPSRSRDERRERERLKREKKVAWQCGARRTSVERGVRRAAAPRHARPAVIARRHRRFYSPPFAAGQVMPGMPPPSFTSSCRRPQRSMLRHYARHATNLPSLSLIRYAMPLPRTIRAGTPGFSLLFGCHATTVQLHIGTVGHGQE